MRLEQRYGDHFVIDVFDRTAKRPLRQLHLGQMFLSALWAKSPATERRVDQWIEETRQQFARKRSNLRLPPAKWRAG